MAVCMCCLVEYDEPILSSMVEMSCCGFYVVNEILTTQMEAIIMCGLVC